MRAFIAVPRRLYAGMPGFVAPLDQERREMLDPRKAAFFAHGEAQYWLARRAGKAVGRISAQIDRLAPATPAGPPGMFGCLDAVDDQGVVTALLRAAETWLRARGCVTAQGPYLLSINGETGLLLDGHTEPAMTLMPWHPAYLDPLLRAAGYARVKTVLSFTLDFTGLDVEAKLRSFGLEQLPQDLTIRGLRLKELDAEAEIARRLYNDAWRNNWGFVPLSEADMKALTQGFKHFLYPECAVIAETEGAPAGFALVVPNITEITADLGGAPSPLGWLKLLLRMLRPRYRSARIILFGLATQYRTSLRGLAIIMTIIAEMIRRGAALGLASIEAGWVLDDNTQVLRMLRSVGFRQSRVYGIYETALTESTP
jgi:hypothetical protein